MTNYFDARNRLVNVNADIADGTGDADVASGYISVKKGVTHSMGHYGIDNRSRSLFEPRMPCKLCSE